MNRLYVANQGFLETSANDCDRSTTWSCTASQFSLSSWSRRTSLVSCEPHPLATSTLPCCALCTLLGGAYFVLRLALAMMHSLC